MCPMPGVEWPRLGNDWRISAHALTRVRRCRLGPSLVIKLFFCGGYKMLIKNVQNQPRRAAGAVTTDERKKIKKIIEIENWKDYERKEEKNKMKLKIK